MKRFIAFALYLFVTSAIAVTLTLTPQQLADIAAQQGGAPAPTPTPTPVPTPTPPPTPGGDTADHCTGFARTVHMRADWANPTRMLTASYGGVGANDIIVFEFTTGNGASQANNLPRVAGAEWGSGAANRIYNLSTKPCDFGPPYMAFSSHGGESSAVTVPFTVLTSDPWGFYPVLATSTTYYLNVKVAPGSGCTTACDMFFDLSKNGTP